METGVLGTARPDLGSGLIMGKERCRKESSSLISKGKTLGHRQSDHQNVSSYLSAMRRKQRFTSTILHDLRNRAGTNRSASSTASVTTGISVRDAARPAILPIPVSSKRLGGRPNKQDKQQPNRPAPTHHRRPDLVDTVRRRHWRNSRLHRRHTRSRRTRTLRRKPRSKHDPSPDILHSRDHRHNIRILLRPRLRPLLGFRWRKLILHRRTVQHHLRHRRSNLRTLRSPPYILPPKKSGSNTTLGSLRDLDSTGFHLPV